MDYQKAYLLLFNAITDSLALMEEQNFGLARQTLISAHQQAENIFLETEQEPL